MIIVKLIGGLGNQMFQYATGRHLSHLHKTDLLIDTSFLDKDTNGAYTKRNLELDVFNLDLKFASKKDIQHFNLEKSTKISRTLQRNFPSLYKYVYAAETGNSFRKGFLNFPRNTYLDGFWQSELYFKNIRQILLNEFQPKALLNHDNEIWLDKISNCQSVSLHIRRGDYVNLKTANNFHGVISLEYYLNAVKFITQHESNIELFVFSDDLDWCRDNLKFENKTHFVDVNEKRNAYLDMFLMRNCKHNIIANSSFSWWGAWLNQNANKIVVAPSHWFADQNIKSPDIIPSTWTQM